MLEQAGHRVVLAADGAAGISYLKKKPFDLVLTDLLMPEMDGMEFITNVRRLQPAARILAMSGGGHISSNEYLKMASRLGAHEVLAKPFTEEKLLATVRALLAGQGPARS